MTEIFREEDDAQVQRDIAAEDDGYPKWWPRHADGSPVYREEA